MHETPDREEFAACDVRLGARPGRRARSSRMARRPRRTPRRPPRATTRSLKAIDDAIRPWDQPGATAPAAAPGWRAFFDALKGELATYSAATASNAKLTSLGRLHQMDLALWGVAWEPAVPVRSALDEWLTPRVRIAWAERRLFDYVEAHRGDSPGSTEHSTALEEVRRRRPRLGPRRATRGRRPSRPAGPRLKRLTGVLASLRKNNQSVSLALFGRAPGGHRRPLQPAEPRRLGRRGVGLAVPVERRRQLRADLPERLRLAGDRRPQDRLRPAARATRGSPSTTASWRRTYTPITDFQQQLEQDREGPQGRQALLLRRRRPTTRRT